MLALTMLLVCSMSLALTANADTTTVPTDLRNVKVGDDLSGATIYVDYSKLSTSFLKTALYTSSYAIYQETASGRQFCYGRASQAGSPSGTIKAWAFPSTSYNPNTGTNANIWKATSEFGGATLTGIVSYTLPSDFGKVTSVNDASMLFVSAAEFSAFKGKTFDDGIPVYAGLELKNTMFAVKKPTFTKTFVQMSGSSDLVRVNLFTTTYSQLIRTNADDIILRHSTNGGMTFTEKYLWNGMSTLTDLRYCTDEAKAFIRSMLLCDNYANYNFGESGYYITGLPGHTVYSNTVGDISSVVGIKVYITTPMLTEYGKTYRLTLVSEEEYTKEESKIPQNWFDEVWNGVSGTGSSVFNGIKIVLCIVLAIVVVILFAKLTSALVYRIQHGAKRRKRK